MKTERRHELQHNVLRDALTEGADRVKPYVRAITGVAIAVVVILGVYLFLGAQSRAKNAQAWDDYQLAVAGDRPQLEKFVASHSGTSVGAWAQLTLADQQSQEGMDKLFSNREEADELLKSATDNFQGVLNNTKDSMMREFATFGLARVYESRGKFDDAEVQYKAVVDKWEDGAFAKRAKERLDDLKKESTQDWYKWFAQTTPKASRIQPKGDFLHPSDEEIPPLRPGLGKGLPGLNGEDFLPGSKLDLNPQKKPGDDEAMDDEGLGDLKKKVEEALKKQAADKAKGDDKGDDALKKEGDNADPNSPTDEKATVEKAADEKAGAEKKPSEKAPVEKKPVEKKTDEPAKSEAKPEGDAADEQP